MKTTIDIADDLFLKAKLLVKRDGVTMKKLVDEGLDNIITLKSERKNVVIDPVVFGGNGLQCPFKNGHWGEIRDFIHNLPSGS